MILGIPLSPIIPRHSKLHEENLVYRYQALSQPFKRMSTIFVHFFFISISISIRGATDVLSILFAHTPWTVIEIPPVTTRTFVHPPRHSVTALIRV
jgi:hypothetical protein